ncbi:MAG: gliding motility lipoprotein GldB [Prolixibacteraceae bacterium]
MKVIIRLVLLFSFVAVLFSCNRNRLKVDISDIETDIEFVRFGEELFSIPLKDTLSELSDLRQKYPGFFDLFTYQVIRIGGIEDENFAQYMTSFLTDTMIQNVKADVEEEFSNIKAVKDEINTAFKYYQYHFPEKELPVVYTCISGFNQSVVTAENIIGISLDKYMGRDYKYYQRLNTIPTYKMNSMSKENIPADVAYAWGMTEFNQFSEATTLLDNMIQEGKLIYFTEALLPEAPDSLIIGYTEQETEWVEENEAEMWMYLVEHKMLYSNKRMDIVRYINDGPYTSGFPLESPGKAGVWIGWQIVRKYMNENEDISVKELMQNTDYQGILNASKYYPE